MALLRRLLRNAMGAPSPLRALALGSCRVHDPLGAAHALGQIEYLNSSIRVSTPIYLHDVHEMLQFLRLANGTLSMPTELAPFAFRDWRPAPQLALLARAERLVTEVCTDKHYEAMGFTLNINEIHRQLVEPAGEAGHAWWSDAHRGQCAPMGVVSDVEATLRRRGKLTKVHGEILRGLSLVTLSATAIAESLARLQRLVSCPILVMPHVAVRLQDGTLLAERTEHIGKVIEAAAQSGLTILNPQRFIDRDAQERVLAEGGRDLHHYAVNYLPIVGLEIVRSLRVL